MDLPALRRILLDMVGTRDLPGLAALGVRDWAKLQAMADQHRLKPLLYAQLGSSPALPPAIRAEWQDKHRVAALQAMLTRHELTECAQLLEATGLAPIALKGAWLARHAYPDPAQRPMRDIDLLVPRGGVLEGYAALLAADYTELEPPEMALAEVVRLDKHMPALLAPRGTVVELHHRLWEPDGRLDHASPAQNEAPSPESTTALTSFIVLSCSPTLANALNMSLSKALRLSARTMRTSAMRSTTEIVTRSVLLLISILRCASHHRGMTH